MKVEGDQAKVKSSRPVAQIELSRRKTATSESIKSKYFLRNIEKCL